MVDATAGPFVVAVDQGTSSTKAVLVNEGGVVVRRAAAAVGASYPAAGHVEQDADEIVESVRRVIDEVLAGTDVKPIAVGFSTQRESAVVWERSSGKVLGPLLGWQDRRTDGEPSDSSPTVQPSASLPSLDSRSTRCSRR